MSANHKYGASRAAYKSSNKRYSPYKKPKRQSNRNSANTGFGAGLVAPDWSQTKLSTFKKDFYQETPKTSSIALQTINKWKKAHSIECFHGFKPNAFDKSFDADGNPQKRDSVCSIKPVMDFADTSFPQVILQAFKQSGFLKPTPIQSATWPLVLSGKNVIGIAKTGSGKTLAFLLPAMVHIAAQPKIQRGDGPIALIIAPTRELAVQIEGEVDKFARYVKHCCVYGGASKGPQAKKLLSGVSIMVATPGRLLDFLESHVTNLRRVTYAVIDEADALLDMGFKPQLNKIMSQIRPDRQMLMFSATWPQEVRALANTYMKGGDIYQVAVGSMDKLVACEDVTQCLRFVGETAKLAELKKVVDEYMDKDDNCKILVFVGMKWFCKKLGKTLSEWGYVATCIHGNKKQSAREQALRQFKSGEINILLATDVAARGLHIDDITLVINYDLPTKIEDYVHRIGRTARAGNKGTAVSFFAPEDGALQYKLIKVLEGAKQEIPPQLKKHMPKIRKDMQKISMNRNGSNANAYKPRYKRRYK